MKRLPGALAALSVLCTAPALAASPVTVVNTDNVPLQLGATSSADGSTTQTVGGTAQVLFSGATPARGWKVFIPSASPGSATCWVSDTTATPSATTAGSYPAALGGGFITEAGQLPAGPVYVNCPTTGQPISAQKW